MTAPSPPPPPSRGNRPWYTSGPSKKGKSRKPRSLFAASVLSSNDSLAFCEKIKTITRTGLLCLGQAATAWWRSKTHFPANLDDMCATLTTTYPNFSPISHRLLAMLGSGTEHQSVAYCYYVDGGRETDPDSDSSTTNFDNSVITLLSWLEHLLNEQALESQDLETLLLSTESLDPETEEVARLLIRHATASHVPSPPAQAPDSEMAQMMEKVFSQMKIFISCYCSHWKCTHLGQEPAPETIASALCLACPSLAPLKNACLVLISDALNSASSTERPPSEMEEMYRELCCLVEECTHLLSQYVSIQDLDPDLQLAMLLSMEDRLSVSSEPAVESTQSGLFEDLCVEAVAHAQKVHLDTPSKESTPQEPTSSTPPSASVQVFVETEEDQNNLSSGLQLFTEVMEDVTATMLCILRLCGVDVSASDPESHLTTMSELSEPFFTVHALGLSHSGWEHLIITQQINILGEQHAEESMEGMFQDMREYVEDALKYIDYFEKGLGRFLAKYLTLLKQSSIDRSGFSQALTQATVSAFPTVNWGNPLHLAVLELFVKRTLRDA